MGLDMYLRGKEVEEILIELGFWWKHPNLHGFIVEKYAKGEDNCKPIHLSAQDLRDILSASEQDKLPHTEGFFFGQSTVEDKVETKLILTRAIKWIESEPEKRSAVYEASW